MTDSQTVIFLAIFVLISLLGAVYNFQNQRWFWILLLVLCSCSLLAVLLIKKGDPFKKQKTWAEIILFLYSKMPDFFDPTTFTLTDKENTIKFFDVLRKSTKKDLDLPLIPGSYQVHAVTKYEDHYGVDIPIELHASYAKYHKSLMLFFTTNFSTNGCDTKCTQKIFYQRLTFDFPTLDYYKYTYEEFEKYALFLWNNMDDSQMDNVLDVLERNDPIPATVADMQAVYPGMEGSDLKIFQKFHDRMQKVYNLAVS